MEEKRHSKRTELASRLLLKRIYGGEGADEVDINVTDVSKSGIGFMCDSPLEIGAVYESFLTIWTKEVLHAFLQIVRIEMVGEAYLYGTSFVGLPEMEASRIETYQTMQEELSDGK